MKRITIAIAPVARPMDSQAVFMPKSKSFQSPARECERFGTDEF
jgi:hypothetical protein